MDNTHKINNIAFGAAKEGEKIARVAWEGLLRRAEGALRVCGACAECARCVSRSYQNDRRDRTTCSAADMTDVAYMADVGHGCIYKVWRR